MAWSDEEGWALLGCATQLHKASQLHKEDFDGVEELIDLMLDGMGPQANFWR